MSQLGLAQQSRLAALACGVCLIVEIGLTKWPEGWVGFVYLAPVVLAPFLLSGWPVVGAGALSLLLWQFFSSVIWIPAPATVFMLISAGGLLQARLHRKQIRQTQGQYREAHKERLEWRAFFDKSLAAILIADGDGRILIANAAAHSLLGCEPGALAGQGLASCLPVLAAALRIEGPNQLVHRITECRGQRANGETFLADVWFSSGKTPMGTRLVAVVVDASERLQERERWGLRSAMATSQIAMKALLHEMRNLCAVAAMIHTNLERLPYLKDNPDFEALGNLVNALANTASAELRPGDSSQTSVDLKALLDQFRIIIEPWLRESEIGVRWELAAALPNVWAEKSGLLQIFLNLVQNSMKAMQAAERKQLTISGHMEGDAVVVRFRDTGPGVAAPDELFRPFQGGAGVKGLGLYISRAIAHSFMGELKYEPTPKGSSFMVELMPLRAVRKAQGEHAYATADRQNSTG